MFRLSVLAALGFALFTIGVHAADTSGSVLVKYVDFKGEGCALKADTSGLSSGALYLDKWSPADRNHCVGCKGISGQENLRSSMMVIAMKEIPAVSSPVDLHFRFYGLHSIYRAHQYETKIKINQDFVSRLAPMKFNEVEMATYYFNEKNLEVKSKCTLVLKFFVD